MQFSRNAKTRPLAGSNELETIGLPFLAAAVTPRNCVWWNGLKTWKSKKHVPFLFNLIFYQNNDEYTKTYKVKKLD